MKYRVGYSLLSLNFNTVFEPPKEKVRVRFKGDEFIGYIEPEIYDGCYTQLEELVMRYVDYCNKMNKVEN